MNHVRAGQEVFEAEVTAAGFEKNPRGEGTAEGELHRPVQAQADRFSKRMPEMTGERGCFSGKERARRLLEQ